MKRRTFDALMATAGLFLAVVLIFAGGMLTWAHNYIGNEVHTRLAAQQVYFPANNSPAIKAPEFAAMHQYAGQQLTTGAQAEVYADHFIAVVVGQGVVVPPGERRLKQAWRAMGRGRHKPRPGRGRAGESGAAGQAGGWPPGRVAVAARGRRGAAGGQAWTCRALLAACSTLGYTEKTSIRPVACRIWRTGRRGAASSRSPPLRRVHFRTRSSTDRPL